MRSVLVTMRCALSEAASDRRALAFQASVMFVNDLVWVGFWAIFFRSSGQVQGWDLHRILLLQATMTVAGGLSLGLISNCRAIGRLALEGGFDAALSLPGGPLRHLLVRKIDPTGIGDLVFGVMIFAVAGRPTPERAVLFGVVTIAGGALMTAFLVLTGSFAFFADREEVGNLGFHTMLVLCGYPVDWFGGVWRTLLSTVIPAVFVASVPARVVDELDWVGGAGVVGVAAVFVVLAGVTFHAGLRRYASGSVWSRA